jgi:hypothetical protein
MEQRHLRSVFEDAVGLAAARDADADGVASRGGRE